MSNRLSLLCCACSYSNSMVSIKSSIRCHARGSRHNNEIRLSSRKRCLLPSGVRGASVFQSLSCVTDHCPVLVAKYGNHFVFRHRCEQLANTLYAVSTLFEERTNGRIHVLIENDWDYTRQHVALPDMLLMPRTFLCNSHFDIARC